MLVRNGSYGLRPMSFGSQLRQAESICASFRQGLQRLKHFPPLDELNGGVHKGITVFPAFTSGSLVRVEVCSRPQFSFISRVDVGFPVDFGFSASARKTRVAVLSPAMTCGKVFWRWSGRVTSFLPALPMSTRLGNRYKPVEVSSTPACRSNCASFCCF